LLPSDVSVHIEGKNIRAKGPKGESSLEISPGLSISIEGNEIRLNKDSIDRRTHQLHGLNRTLLNNLLIGVDKGFEKKMTLVGVGFRAKITGQTLTLSVGYTHDVIVQLPKNINAAVNQNVNISIYGIDKAEVGQFAAKLRSIRQPEPYGGKGIRYADEVLKLKEGKSGKK
jgi:large subunit ribosomal protein L6